MKFAMTISAPTQHKYHTREGDSSKEYHMKAYVRYDICTYGYPLRSCLWVRLRFIYVALGFRSTTGCAGSRLACTFPTYRFFSLVRLKINQHHSSLSTRNTSSKRPYMQRVYALPNLETTTDKEDLRVISQVIGTTWSCAGARPLEQRKPSMQLHITELQAHPAAATLNEVPNNRYPISKSSEHSPTKSYTLYR